MQKTRSKVLLVTIYLWLSFIIHVYAFYFAGLNISLRDLLQKMGTKPPADKAYVLQNIILETAQEQSPPEEETPFISDKNTLNASLDADRSRPQLYNNPATLRPNGGQADIEKPDQSQSMTGQVRPQQEGGEGAPFYFDPAKEPIVNLYTSGNVSVAAEAKDYAGYFIAMQKKIGVYHKEFFPIYQYYQGLLRDGVVIVDFVVDKKGDVVSAEIVSSYGVKTVDQASLNSIIYAKNFGPLPEDLAKSAPIKIRFHFVYFGR
ncbi:MAG: energy transducer TonB family protein [Brevinema sp.]